MAFMINAYYFLSFRYVFSDIYNEDYIYMINSTEQVDSNTSLYKENTPAASITCTHYNSTGISQM